jgi:predicted transcriptional regulator of viral defense system
MNGREAYARLRRLGVPAIDTSDAAAALQQSTAAASMTLSRLVQAGLVAPVRHGQWWLDGPIDPYRLPEHLTAPLPSYVSLHTALHLRGLIEQIPEVFYAVSLARTQRITTRAGTFSIHHASRRARARSRSITSRPKCSAASTRRRQA